MPTDVPPDRRQSDVSKTEAGDDAERNRPEAGDEPLGAWVKRLLQQASAAHEDAEPGAAPTQAATPPDSPEPEPAPRPSIDEQRRTAEAAAAAAGLTPGDWLNRVIGTPSAEASPPAAGSPPRPAEAPAGGAPGGPDFAAAIRRAAEQERSEQRGPAAEGGAPADLAAAVRRIAQEELGSTAAAPAEAGEAPDIAAAIRRAAAQDLATDAEIVREPTPMEEPADSVDLVAAIRRAAAEDIAAGPEVAAEPTPVEAPAETVDLVGAIRLAAAEDLGASAETAPATEPEQAEPQAAEIVDLAAAIRLAAEEDLAVKPELEFVPPPPPEPVDFAQAIRQAAAEDFATTPAGGGAPESQAGEPLDLATVVRLTAEQELAATPPAPAPAETAEIVRLPLATTFATGAIARPTPEAAEVAAGAVGAAPAESAPQLASTTAEPDQATLADAARQAAAAAGVPVSVWLARLVEAARAREPDEGPPPSAEQLPVPVRRLPVGAVAPGRFQMRSQIDPEEVQALAESIRSRGVLQPILVRARREGGEADYEIIAGERRWRAAQIAGLAELPALVLDVPDREAMEIALIENLQRHDLGPLDEAEGYRRLIEDLGSTQEALAEVIGKSRSYISNMLRLLRLPEPIKALLAEGKLSAGHARALLTARDAEHLAARAVAEGLSVRDVERLAQVEPSPPGEPRRVERDPELEEVEAELSRLFGVAVKINLNATGDRGTLSIRFKGLDKLHDLIDRLKT